MIYVINYMNGFSCSGLKMKALVSDICNNLYFFMNEIKNWPALDVVKFICVLVMIWVHAHFALISDFYRITDTSGFFYRISEKFMFLSLFVMMLPILAGVALRTYENLDIGKIAKLAILMAFFGFFMNALTWGPGYAFSWNVLQFLGLSFIAISFLMKYFSIREVFLLSLLVLFSAGPLRNILSGFSNIYLVSIFTGADNRYIFWPFFPWFSLVGFGFIFAHLYEKYGDTGKFNLGTFLIGLSLIFTAVLRNEASPFLDPKYIWGPSLFQPKIGFVLAIIGLFCVLISIANTFFNGIKLRKYGIINSYSKGILWIYLFQMFYSFYLSIIVKAFFPMKEPRMAYFILPILMIFLSWQVGVISIKALQEKKLIITLKKLR